MKYNIDKELFPLGHIRMPVRNEHLAAAVGSLMRTPGWIFRDEDIKVSRRLIRGYKDSIEILIIEPADREALSPALVYYHGGAFIFGAAGHHYRMARIYALATGATVLFVNYSLAPEYRYPTQPEDCYAALRYAYTNSILLGIDRSRIAVAGDSAGGALAAAVVQMSRDRGVEMPLFQMLIYPVMDKRMKTESMRDYTDTPMWDARASEMMWRAYLPKWSTDTPYASPAEATDLSGLCSAYIETAEFDCLRDEAIDYAQALEDADIDVELNETEGTVHAFDLKLRATVTEDAIDARIAYMNKMYGNEDEV